MARTRSIRPGFFANEYLADLSFEARLLFIGLWTIADRKGRLEDRPKRIKAALFPYDNMDIDALLNDLALSREQFIIRYEVDGERYLQINNFGKHQHFHKDEAESTLPAPTEHGANTVQAPTEHGANTVQAPTEHGANTPCISNLVACSLELVEANASCTEPPSGTVPEPVITLTLNDKTEYPITEEQTHEWATLYPAVDVIQQLRNMKGWIDTHPKKRKTKRGILGFINGWLMREQDSGKTTGNKSPPTVRYDYTNGGDTEGVSL